MKAILKIMIMIMILIVIQIIIWISHMLYVLLWSKDFMISQIKKKKRDKMKMIT